MLLERTNIQGNKVNFDQNLILYPTTDITWIMNFSVKKKKKPIKLMKKKKGKSSGSGVEEEFLKLTPKAQSIKEKL